ncbi:hypothetical protein LJC27_00130 [Christensenellaceae bacterium OttesenSCG-928-M15]|nr:hypothetical protein [Christensenellaceae bacterium OttesenSCG-928-M15]
MKRLMRCIGILLCLLLLNACAVQQTTEVVNPAQSDERLLSEVRMQYRDASLIVEGVCSGIHVDADGNDCYDLIVETVYAGSATAGDRVHCSSYSDMSEGERYVLFLGTGEDVHYAEDVIGYELLTEAPLKVVDNEIILGGKRLALNVLEGEIEQLSNVISAPAPVYYYDTLEKLANDADEVFIGQVVNIPEYNGLYFDIRNGGATEKARYSASIATVEVLGPIKGVLGASYGMQIQLVHSPEFANSMVDEKTLKSSGFSTNDMPELKEGELYLFFLKESPDDKQAYYFMVNPLQGAVRVDGVYLDVHEKNAAMFPYATLKSAVEDMREIFQYDAVRDMDDEDAPVLVIEE